MRGRRRRWRWKTKKNSLPVGWNSSTSFSSLFTVPVEMRVSWKPLDATSCCRRELMNEMGKKNNWQFRKNAAAYQEQQNIATALNFWVSFYMCLSLTVCLSSCLPAWLTTTSARGGGKGGISNMFGWYKNKLSHIRWLVSSWNTRCTQSQTPRTARWCNGMGGKRHSPISVRAKNATQGI